MVERTETTTDPALPALAARLVEEAAKALARDDDQPLTERVLREYRQAGKAATAAVLAALAGGRKGASVANLPEAGIVRLRDLAAAAEAVTDAG